MRVNILPQFADNTALKSSWISKENSKKAKLGMHWATNCPDSFTEISIATGRLVYKQDNTQKNIEIKHI